MGTACDNTPKNLEKIGKIYYTGCPKKNPEPAQINYVFAEIIIENNVIIYDLLWLQAQP
jgi:hypothetical protein